MSISINHQKRVFAYVLIWLMLHGIAIAQNSNPGAIRGKVFDTEDNTLLKHVHVYLSNTTIGTVTNEIGEFLLNTGLRGNYTLVFSHVGYETKTLEIRLGENAGYDVEVYLSPAVYDLGGVAVSGQMDEEWKQNLEIFKEKFIGTSFFAQETEITNPWVIEFSTDDERNLEAYATEPLLINNNALGYHIHADLTGFRWNLDEDTGFYTFFHLFTEMESDSWRQRRRWRHQRRDAFKGSFEHFLHSLYSNELARNSFAVVMEDSYDPNTIVEIAPDELNRHLNGKYSNPKTYPDIKGYRISGNVDILFGRRYTRNIVWERSRLVPMHSSGLFLVTESGWLFNPLSLRIDGIWSRQRVGDLLPAGYGHDD